MTRNICAYTSTKYDPAIVPDAFKKVFTKVTAIWETHIWRILLSRKCWQQLNWMWTFATRHIDSVKMLKAHGLATHFYLYVRQAVINANLIQASCINVTQIPHGRLHCFYQHNHETTEDKHTCAVGMHINTYVAHNHGYICSCTHINQCLQLEIHIRCTSINIDPSIQLT